MKKIKIPLLLFVMSLILAFTVGCGSTPSSQESVDTKESKDKYTYSVVFQLTAIGDVFLDFGTLTLTYLDSKGESKSVNVTADLIPLEISSSDFSAGDPYSFELKFERSATLPELTKVGYKTSKGYNLSDIRSDGVKRHLYSSGGSSTSTIAADKLEAYLDKYTSRSIISYSVTIAE